MTNFKLVNIRFDVKEMLDLYRKDMSVSTGLAEAGLSYNDVLRWMDKRLDNKLNK